VGAATGLKMKPKLPKIPKTKKTDKAIVVQARDKKFVIFEKGSKFW
jgi:hypothetical protein